MHRIFYIMGKSATGKDKLYRNLLAYFSENEPILKPLVLYTTRPMRTGEENGKDYWFVDRASFLKMKEAGSVIEERTYDTIHGPGRILHRPPESISQGTAISGSERWNPSRNLQDISGESALSISMWRSRTG